MAKLKGNFRQELLLSNRLDRLDYTTRLRYIKHAHIPTGRGGVERIMEMKM